MLCFETCLTDGVTSRAEQKREIDASFEKVRAEVWDRLAQAFKEPCARFCRGNRFRRAGRAPYLQIFKWLAESGEWLLRIKDQERRHAEMRNSLNEIITKGHLQKLVTGDPDLPRLIHYDSDAQTLIVEGPQFVFFIQNMPWRSFAREIGFTNIDIDRRYDFALTFAGSDRDIAEKIAAELTTREFEVFYDRNEQARMLASDIEAYLKPIYQSEAQFVVCLLGKDYPNRIWTRFEQEQYRDRIPDGEVIPILIGDVQIDSFSELSKIAHESFSRRVDIEVEIERICDLLENKLECSR